jgi:ankyrin repeat protein
MVLLLQRGADPLLELQDGKTTVIHEIAYQQGNIAPILKFGVDLEIKDSQNRTPLLVACAPDTSIGRRENENTTCDLILAGADIQARDIDGSTPLHLAVQSRLFKTVTLLLEKGASASTTNNAGLAPIYFALSLYYQDQLKFTKCLLDGGAEPLVTSPSGTALHLLAPTLMDLSPSDGFEFEDRVYQQRDETDYVTEFTSLYDHFVNAGCDRNARDHLGNTPLFPYVKSSKLGSDYMRAEAPAEKDVTKMFDEHDVFAVNDEGDTLLHAVATREEDSDSEATGVWLFKELMARGVDPRQENKKRSSPLDVAAAFGKTLILGLFAREEQ